MKLHSSAASLALAVVVVLGIAGPATAGAPVPFKGVLEGTVTRTPLAPPLVSVQLNATGNATQLGLFKLSFPHTVNATTRAATGTYHFVAANGDRLTAAVTGRAMPTATPGVLSIVETAIITGGTGRFAGATGSFRVERLFNANTGLTTGFFTGAISTP